MSDEPSAFASIHAFLSYLPTSTSRIPPSIIPPAFQASQQELLSIIPRKRTQTYDIRRLVEVIVDVGTWFEMGATWGKSIVIGLARINGRSIGVITQDCREKGGTLDAKSAEKVRRFVDLWCGPLHVLRVF